MIHSGNDDAITLAQRVAPVVQLELDRPFENYVEVK
jgi:hypothetical protein